MSKTITFAIAASTIVGLVLLVCFQADTNAPAPQSTTETVKPPTLRLGIIPERDIFQQRKSYRLLADYVQAHGVGTPQAGIEVVTASSYGAILEDLQEGQIDAAFVGSLIAVLAADRHGAQIVLKSENLDGESTYAGVVFVTDASPAKSFRDLAGKRIGAVRTTTAGAVYPLFLMRQLGWEAKELPTLVWSGTHDDVIREVVAGTQGGGLDAGAAKSSRLDAFQKAHPEIKLRRLAESNRVPDNALILRKDLPAAQREKLVSTLLAMDRDPCAAPVLASLELKRFLPCSLAEYAALYDMIDAIGPGWFAMGIDKAPRRPAEATVQDAAAGEGGHP